MKQEKNWRSEKEVHWGKVKKCIGRKVKRGRKEAGKREGGRERTSNAEVFSTFPSTFYVLWGHYEPGEDETKPRWGRWRAGAGAWGGGQAHGERQGTKARRKEGRAKGGGGSAREGR